MAECGVLSALPRAEQAKAAPMPCEDSRRLHASLPDNASERLS